MDPLFGELTDPASLNRFVYAGANPLTFTDPTGLKKADGGGGCRHCWDEVIAEINEDDPDQSAAVEGVPTDLPPAGHRGPGSDELAPAPGHDRVLRRPGHVRSGELRQAVLQRGVWRVAERVLADVGRFVRLLPDPHRGPL